MPTWTLGDVIRRRRKAKGPRWTQLYLGQQCRPPLNKDQITRAETGKAISPDTLTRIATALGTTVDALHSEATANDGNSAVRNPNRTRYSRAEPLDNDRTRLDPAQGEEADMPVDPHLASLNSYWLHLDDAQHAELVALAATMYSQRRRAVGESPGKIRG
jgi:transcriptional regulator with XRE-family HTH domain